MFKIGEMYVESALRFTPSTFPSSVALERCASPMMMVKRRMAMKSGSLTIKPLPLSFVLLLCVNLTYFSHQ